MLSLTARITFIRAPAVLIWGVLLIVAPAAEYLQLLQPARGFSRMDIVANLTGIVLAALIWSFLTLLYRYYLARKTRE